VHAHAAARHGIELAQVDLVGRAIEAELDARDVHRVRILGTRLAQHVGIPGQLLAAGDAPGRQLGTDHRHQLAVGAAVGIHGEHAGGEAPVALGLGLVARVEDQAVVVDPLEMADVDIQELRDHLDAHIRQVDDAEPVVAFAVVDQHGEPPAVRRQLGGMHLGVVEKGAERDGCLHALWFGGERWRGGQQEEYQ
jgi:hypothetical protein